MKAFDPTERMASLMELRGYALKELEELNDRIANFPKLEPEYEDLPEIPLIGPDIWYQKNDPRF